VLEGYVIALDHLDEVIALIRASENVPQAHAGLVARFGLSEIQAEEILKLQLQRLTALERHKIQEELAELQARILDLKDILQSPRRIDAIVGGELRQIAAERGDLRRTQIVEAADEITVEDMIAEEDVAI